MNDARKQISALSRTAQAPVADGVREAAQILLSEIDSATDMDCVIAASSALRTALASSPAQVDAKDAPAAEVGELNALRQYALDATKAITGLTAGGSEYFGKQIGDVYTADLPLCVERIRTKIEAAHKAKAEALRQPKPQAVAVPDGWKEALEAARSHIITLGGNPHPHDPNADQIQAAILALITQALATAPSPSSSGTGWRPIETAPHGVEVLLATPPFASMGEQAKWELHVGYASWGERVGGYSNRSRDAHATHWLPLPAAPVSDGGEHG